MRRPILLAVVLGAALLATVSATAGTSSKARHAATSYTDPAGDSGTAADVVGASVSSDDNGQYTFHVQFNSALATTHIVGLYLDTDVSSWTGDPAAAGADYAIWQDQSNGKIAFGRWNVGGWEYAPGGSSIQVTAPAPTELMVSVNRSDLHGSSAFNFWIDSWDGTGGSGHEDLAPDGTATWHYQPGVQEGTLSLAITDSALTTPEAGGMWGVAISVTRSDTGATVSSEAAIRCRATGRGTALRVLRKTFISGAAEGETAAVCIFRVPKALRNRLVRATITVSYSGLSVSRTFTARAL
jgi:hypothetical protein